VGSDAINVGREHPPESMIVGSCALLILMAKSETGRMQGHHTLVNSVSQSATPHEHDFAISITFGDGCPEVFVIQAFMQFSHFWGYRSNNFFNSMRWTEDTSPKVRKSLKPFKSV
jgi:hypothetical protein